jgi:hypothetical protein
MLSGTGIRDRNEGGYISPSVLGLSQALVSRIAAWVQRYEDAHYLGYQDENEIRLLDEEGMTIARMVSGELPDSKVEFYSSARMKHFLL